MTKTFTGNCSGPTGTPVDQLSSITHEGEKAMFANTGDAGRQHPLTIQRWAALVALLVPLFFAPATVRAQNTFSSGSTGADGPFSPTTTQSIAVPESGVFNYTTVNIPSGVTITYTRSSTNKPLTILASGNVVIAGTTSSSQISHKHNASDLSV